MKSIEVLLQVRVVVPTCLSVEFVIICDNLWLEINFRCLSVWVLGPAACSAG